MSPEPSGQPRKAYYVEESTKGCTLWLVFADNAREAKERFIEHGEAIDNQQHPNGVRAVRRAREEDRDA